MGISLAAWREHLRLVVSAAIVAVAMFVGVRMAVVGSALPEISWSGEGTPPGVVVMETETPTGVAPQIVDRQPPFEAPPVPEVPTVTVAPVPHAPLP